MVEITALTNAKIIMTRKDGSKVVFLRQKPRYFHEEDEIVARINAMSELDRAKTFVVNQDIKTYKLSSDWAQNPPRALEEVLKALGVESDTPLKVHSDYVAAIEECITRGLIEVEAAPVAPEAAESVNYVKLKEGYKTLEGEIATLREQMTSQTAAFEQALAQVIAERDEAVQQVSANPRSGNAKK